MMSRTWSFYERTTGDLHRFHYSGPERGLALNTPANHVAIEGKFDPRSQRVDLSSGGVIDAIPEAPDAAHIWDSQNRRYVLPDAVRQCMTTNMLTQAGIEALEAKQPRAMRELALGRPGAKERLQKIDDDIAALRAQVNATQRE